MSTLFKVKYWVGPFNSWALPLRLKHWGGAPVINASGHFSESIKMKVRNRLPLLTLRV